VSIGDKPEQAWSDVYHSVFHILRA
jgi:hypothetical protein